MNGEQFNYWFVTNYQTVMFGYGKQQSFTYIVQHGFSFVEIWVFQT